VESEPDLILEATSSIREAMRRMVRYASDATEALEAGSEDEDLNGQTETVELRETLERVQNLSLQTSE
jgi:hypothetical protein